MKSVDKQLIKKISSLAKLSFSDKELEQMKTDFERILSFIEKINELPLEEVEPLIHIHEYIDTPLREDEPEPPLPKQEALMNAPKHDSDYFRVPKFVKKEEGE